MTNPTYNFKNLEKTILTAIIDLETRLKNEFDQLRDDFIFMKDDVNILKDTIVDIRIRLDKEQLPFIEKIIDTNCKRLDDHEVRITKLENVRNNPL